MANQYKYTIELTKDELIALIKATNWANQEYFKQNAAKESILVANINEKLNGVYNEKIHN